MAARHLSYLVAMRRCLFAVLAVILCACQADAPVATAKAPAPASPPQPIFARPPVVTLLSAGAEPRWHLGYRIAGHSAQTSAFRTTYQLEVASPGIPTGPLILPALSATVITRASATGHGPVPVHMDIADLSALPRPGATFAVIDATNHDLALLAGTTIDATADERGLHQTMAPAISMALSHGVRHLVARARRQIAGLSIPLPRKKVGIGARWQVTTEVVEAGVRMVQRATYELLARTGDGLTVHAIITRSAPPQTVAVSGPHGPATAAITSYAAAGDGTLEIDPTRVLARKAKLTVRAHMAMTVTAASQTRAMEMTSTATTTLR